MTSLIDGRQAIRLLLESPLDKRIIINEGKIVRGVAVGCGEERIVVDEKLRVDGNSRVCGQRRFTPSERVALTESAPTVLSNYRAKRYSTRKLKPPPRREAEGSYSQEDLALADSLPRSRRETRPGSRVVAVETLCRTSPRQLLARAPGRVLRFPPATGERKALQPHPMKPSTRIIQPTLSPKFIAYARSEELILCDQHAVARLVELHLPHFEIVSDQDRFGCCRCGRPAGLYDLPFYLQHDGSVAARNHHCTSDRF